MAHLEVNEIAMTNKGVGTMKKRLALEPILSLILIITLALTACTSETSGTTNTNDTTLETDSETTEPSKDSVNANPLLTEEMWGEVPSEEEALSIYQSTEHKRLKYYNGRPSWFSRIETNSQNWILQNAQGQSLYCKDGLLYGDMVYYRPTDAEIDVGYKYDNNYLFVDASDKFIYLPGDAQDTDLVITCAAGEVTSEGTVVWLYCDGAFEPVATYEEYRESCTITKVPTEFGLFMRGGTKVEKVVIENNSVKIFGENAEFQKIQVHQYQPSDIIFES